MDLRRQTADGQVIANFNLHEPGPQAPDRLTRLIRHLGRHRQETEIRHCFNIVCRESLQPGAGWSSLNADGTPVQFALSLLEGQRPAFEFVGEAFHPHMDYSARRAFGLETMTCLSHAIGLKEQFATVKLQLETLADGEPAGDWEDPAGAFWMGAAFAPADPISMMVYVNARRGPEKTRLKRLLQFARSSAPKAEWLPVFEAAEAGGLNPLGAGLRIGRHAHSHTRVYFGAYGVKPDDYRRWFRQAGAGEPFDGSLAIFFEQTLRTRLAFPTQSGVFSFGVNGSGEWSPKLELCGHCTWKTDHETASGCVTWLRRLRIDADLYRGALQILTHNNESQQSAVHAYIGVGTKHAKPYASIYFNPGRMVL